MDLLKVKNLKMYYKTMRGDVKAVDDVSFEIDKQDALGLVGESGCGKTSTALALLKLLPSNGRIIGGSATLENQELTKMSEKEIRMKIRWKKISIIFQGAMNALHPTYPIGHQIVEAILTHEDVSKEEAFERAAKLLEMVGIGAEKIDRYPHELSGGMKQRAVTAMALSSNPELLIADEPTTALDVIVQAQVLKVLKELGKKLKLSWMLITHDLSIVTETCNKIAVMYAGKIMEYGDLASIYKEPLHPYTQRLLKAFPSVTGPKSEMTSIPGFPPDLLNPPSGCRFHPRCSFAMEICKKKEPPIEKTSKAHQVVACHLYTQV